MQSMTHDGIKKTDSIPLVVDDLLVERVKNNSFLLPKRAELRHVILSEGLSNEEMAVKISQNRKSKFARKIGKNTVFAKPKGYRLCSVFQDGNLKVLIISVNPVNTYQCNYEKQSKTWSSIFLGTFYVSFESFEDNIAHFPSILYKKVVWPS